MDHGGEVIASGECGENGDNVTWTLYEDGLLSISGTGDMADYYSSPWYNYSEKIEKAIVSYGVTSIGDYAFECCKSLASIEIPEGVTSIGAWTFYECGSLTEIEIPKSVTSIGERAFSMCTDLKNIEIPPSVTNIESYAFGFCVNLTSIEIPANVEELGNQAFQYCANLTSIRFDKPAPNIGEDAFVGVTATAYYPAGDDTWNSEIMQDYGGTITWVPYTSGTKNMLAINDSETLIKECSDSILTEEEDVKPETITNVDSRQESMIETYAIYGGEYETQESDTHTLKSASFTGLIPDEQYLLLAMVSLEAENPLGTDNLLYIDQASADANGNLSFQYIQRVPTDLSYVIACGPSNKNLNDAQITFPAMYADDEIQVVNPTVIYDGETLVENQDYVLVGTVDYTKAGTYICYVRGVRNYTGLVKCSYTVNLDISEPQGVERIYGATRYETSLKIADAYKEKTGVAKFNTIIIASGTNFADALAGSYLASVNIAPILMYNNKPGKSNVADIVAYVNANLATGGKVYLLGGISAVGTDVESALSAYNVKRLGGDTRYDTNLEILAEAGVGSADILVCTGQNFADSLSGSAIQKPIRLVNNKKGVLTDAQKAFLGSLSGNKLYVVGGTSAVSANLEMQLKAFGNVERIGGENRYETSVLLAEKFFDAPKAAVLALGKNFPDGLCGGMLAISMDAPLVLTISNQNSKAADTYAEKYGIQSGVVLGGPGLIEDDTVRNIFNMQAEENIIVK